MHYALGFLLSAFVVAIVAAPLFRERRMWAALAPSTRRAILLEQRDTTLRELKDLDFDRRMGKIDDADYAELHASAAARATAVLDALEATKPSGRVRNGSSSAPWLHALDAEAEVFVARARLRLRGSAKPTPGAESETAPKSVAKAAETLPADSLGAWVCECGRAMKSSDKFCGSCGAMRPQV